MSSVLGGVKKRGDWAATRPAIESAIQSVVGKLPKEPIDPQAKIVDEQQMSGYIRRRVNYFVDEWSRISAWMFVPEEERDCPAILCLHGRSAAGKEECAGADGLNPALAFARHYAELGYVTLAADSITCGERVSSRGLALDTRQYYKDNPKLSALGKMLWDNICALDVLSQSKEVDPGRLGVIGHDLGGANALLLAAFEDRVRAVVSSCGFTRFAAEQSAERWAPDEGLVLLPKLREAFQSGAFPFDWEDVLALVAPNPVLIASAANDEVLPNAGSVAEAVSAAQSVYDMLGAKDALCHFVHQGGHDMAPEAAEQAEAWFDRWL